MASKTINLGDFSGELQAFTDRTIEDQRNAVRSGVLRSMSDLAEASPVDTGLYAASWDFSETEQSMILGNSAPHAAIIERGARPFTPPIRPLLQWAKRVLQDSSQPPNYSSDVWALARGTQNKIKEQGIAPRHVLERTIPTIIENIRKEFAAIE